jgi:hypothetical protein
MHRPFENHLAQRDGEAERGESGDHDSEAQGVDQQIVRCHARRRFTGLKAAMAWRPQ